MIIFSQYMLKYKLKCLEISTLHGVIICKIFYSTCLFVLSDLLLAMSIYNFTTKNQ